MTRIIQFLKDYFEVNKHESLRILWGTCAGILLVSGVIFFNHYFSTNEIKILLSEYNDLDKPLSELKSKERNRFKSRIPKSESIKYTIFNPNTATEEILLKNGISKYAAKNLINFRNKGKVYKTKEELLKVYGLSENLYKRIEPYIDLPSQEDDRDYNTFERIYEDTTSVKVTFKAPSINPFDINLASMEDLTQIRGIGEVFAKRIIKYREGLGGFYKLEQVKNTYGLADSTYQELVKFAFLNEPNKKVKINKIETNDWKTSLLKNYQKKAIIAYRKQHGNFKTIEDLAPIRVLNPKLLEQISPYLDFSIEE
ncbi:helix-hairpin-helix domain-containing protein [uncultured Arcticibacterium sp.]|uniref:ComEA family DNA-binding protein n=1 Tax=uncultured Arcticibacterium sp. TaxID=2173042 RepID=UPI0030F5468B